MASIPPHPTAPQVQCPSLSPCLLLLLFHSLIITHAAVLHLYMLQSSSTCTDYSIQRMFTSLFHLRFYRICLQPLPLLLSRFLIASSPVRTSCHYYLPFCSKNHLTLFISCPTIYTLSLHFALLNEEEYRHYYNYVYFDSIV